MATRRFSFDDLEYADLFIDAIYEGGIAGNVADDPLNRLVGAGNMGGFRYEGSVSDGEIRFCILYSSLADPDWPDDIDPQTGLFTYYGDHRHAGRDLHDTPRKGNIILREAFANLHTGSRERVPPFFVFTKTAPRRDVRFRGLAVPGAAGISQTNDLVAIWKIKAGERFQNYKAIFTILDVPVVSRQWIRDIKSGAPLSATAPSAWMQWIKNGTYEPLRAERSVRHRTREEQIPQTQRKRELLSVLYDHYQHHPDGAYAFERCAVGLVKLMDQNIVRCDLTRPWRDGGRDALGEYRIGSIDNAIDVEFALEAKCYRLDRGVGVREISRLISRMRYRQFGILVTTSYVSEQAYREVVDDGHPVIIISASDIADILVNGGFNGKTELVEWLQSLPSE